MVSNEQSLKAVNVLQTAAWTQTQDAKDLIQHQEAFNLLRQLATDIVDLQEQGQAWDRM